MLGGRPLTLSIIFILLSYYQGDILSAWLTIDDVDLDPLAKVMFVRFLPNTYTCLHTVLLEGITIHNLLGARLLELEYIISDSSAWEISLLSMGLPVRCPYQYEQADIYFRLEL